MASNRSICMPVWLRCDADQLIEPDRGISPAGIVARILTFGALSAARWRAGQGGARTESGGVLFPDSEGGPLADASLTPARPGVCLFDRLPGVSTACLLIDRATGGPRGFRRTFGQ